LIDVLTFATEQQLCGRPIQSVPDREHKPHWRTRLLRDRKHLCGNRSQSHLYEAACSVFQQWRQILLFSYRNPTASSTANLWLWLEERGTSHLYSAI